MFYWYSVPHDRLFLDALERDLKREKMNQEATTMAVSEPALSFEFDSSQSLFEQLTKAQQANSSSFTANAGNSAFSSPPSPVMRAADSMPPPSLIPQSLPPVSEDMQTPMQNYTGVSMPSAMAHHISKREPDFQMQYDRNGVPIGRIHQRHTSVPAYMEYSPAPSFVSSHYEDYSNRGISFEPVTPPQHAQQITAEPAYLSSEEPTLYGEIPHAAAVAHGYPSMMAMPSAIASMGYSNQRQYPSNQVYSVIEGSPTYKQRRRRSSIPPSISAAVAAVAAASNPLPHAPHRSSDLRRSMSLANPNNTSNDLETASPATYHGPMTAHRDFHDGSRHQSPSIDHQTAAALHGNEEYNNYNEESNQSLSISPTGRPGPIRRARSATMMELGPYPHKSHSCPIPTCGRLFKRLEHLKR